MERTATLAAIPPATDEPRILPVGALAGEWMEAAQANFDARVHGKPRGPLLPFAGILPDLGEAWPVGAHVIHGQPGTGKTAFGLQTATETGCPALFVTTEMSPLELLRRIVARVTETYLGRLRSGEIHPDDMRKLLNAAAARVPYLVIADATQTPAPSEWIRRTAEATRGKHDHLLVVIDSLHSWVDSQDTDASEYEALNGGCAALRKLAHQLSCAVVMIAERNRVSMKNGGLSAGAGTRKIEYGAETVIDLACDENAPIDGRGEKRVTLKVVKNRNGSCGETALMFHGALQRFREE